MRSWDGNSEPTRRLEADRIVEEENANVDLYLEVLETAGSNGDRKGSDNRGKSGKRT